MSTRRSARLRAKGRRRWADRDNEDTGDETSVEDTVEEPVSKRARVENLDDEEDENDQDYMESESGEEDKAIPPGTRSRGRFRTSAARKSPTADKAWDQVHEEDDENAVLETAQDYPLEVEVFGVDKYFVVDGYVYRRLPTERKCGLGGFYLRCRQDKALNCDARAIAVPTENGKLMAKLSGSASEHNHERPPDGSFLVPLPSGSGRKVGSSQRSVKGRKRGRPSRTRVDNDDDETDDGETDHPSKYKVPVEIFGMQKYFVMDGYVYRRHRDRRVGLRGIYLRCYQDKDLTCSARAMGVWFRRRSDLATGDRSERLLFGRMSTRYSVHSHSKPPKGHFLLKSSQQQYVLVPPHLRQSGAGGGRNSAEFMDFPGESNEVDISGMHTIGQQSRSTTLIDDHRYETSTNVERQRSSLVVDTGRNDAGRLGGATLTSNTSAITAPVVQRGSYYMIDGYAFKRVSRQQPQLVCVELDREAGCEAEAILLPKESTSKGITAGLKAQFSNSVAKKHSHGRPGRGQYFVQAAVPTAPVIKPTPAMSMRGLSASSALLLFTRTPFVRPLTVAPSIDGVNKNAIKGVPRMTNVKSIMNCYRHCMDALIALQEGYYVGRFPQLNSLVGAPGSELIDYYLHRSDRQLPMIAGDERTKFMLNNELKHYRAVVEFMLLAPNECVGLMAAYRRWLTPSRSRAWWNCGDVLEYVCRLLLRSPDYIEAYEVALATSQQSTRLRYLFRPLLPLPEPKYLRCERETVRRWEMRQSLETVNSRIASVRSREGDNDSVINRLFDEFESAVSSFRKFLARHYSNQEDKDDANLVSSDDDWAQIDNKAEKSKRKSGRDSSRGVEQPPAPMESDSDGEDDLYVEGNHSSTRKRRSGKQSEII